MKKITCVLILVVTILGCVHLDKENHSRNFQGFYFYFSEESEYLELLVTKDNRVFVFKPETVFLGEGIIGGDSLIIMSTNKNLIYYDSRDSSFYFIMPEHNFELFPVTDLVEKFDKFTSYDHYDQFLFRKQVYELKTYYDTNKEELIFIPIREHK